MRHPLRQRLTALALAGVYALLAAGGQGLHAVSHALSLAGASIGDNHAACGCGDAGCFFAPSDRSEDRAPDETTLHRADDASGHDQDKCGLCQTLAQMKLAAAGGPAVAPHLTATAPAPVAPEGLAFSALTTAFDARGPPTRG